MTNTKAMTDEQRERFEAEYGAICKRNGRSPRLSTVRGGVFAGQYICNDAEMACDLWQAALSAPTQSREDKMVTLEFTNGLPNAWCDPEIADLVKALNDGGLRTIASCSGHAHRPGSIVLEDKRELLIMTFDEARAVDALFPIDINGNRMPAPMTTDNAKPCYELSDTEREILSKAHRSSVTVIPADNTKLIEALEEISKLHPQVIVLPQPNMEKRTDYPELIYNFQQRASKALSDYHAQSKEQQ